MQRRNNKDGEKTEKKAKGHKKTYLVAGSASCGGDNSQRELLQKDGAAEVELRELEVLDRNLGAVGALQGFIHSPLAVLVDISRGGVGEEAEESLS